MGNYWDPNNYTLENQLSDMLRGKDVVIFATMSKSGGTATLDRMEEKVKARGGRVIERFSIKTKGKSDSYLKKYSEAYAKILDLSLYH